MKNPLKQKLKNGGIAIGTIVMLGHPDVTEWLSRVGFDWLFLDTEHAPLGLETLQQMIQSMNGTTCVPIVRPQWNDPVVIKRILDIGAYGVIVPMVGSKEEAESVVRACKYPPEGIRGFGPRRVGMFDSTYFETANEEIMVTVLIETDDGVRNIDEILSVDGVDAAFIGYADLSLSMGFGMPLKWDEPRYLEAYDKVVKAAEKWGKIAGLHTSLSDSPGNIEWAVERGFRMVTVSDADTFMIEGARIALDRAHQAVAERQI